MKGFLFAFVAVVLGGALILVWKSHGNVPQVLNLASKPTKPAASMLPGNKKNNTIKSTAATQPVVNAGTGSDQQPIDEIAAAGPLTIPTVAARVSHPFPQPNQISIGARQNALTQQYGDPALSTATLNNGHLLQTLIYAQDGDDLLTVVRVVDGTVSAAYAKSAPPSARGRLLLPQALND